MNLLNPVAVVFGLIVFVVQFFLCCRTRKTLIRLLPAMVIAVGFIVCAIVYLMAGSMGTSLIAVVDLILLAVLLAVDGLGWLAYCVARFIQNVR